MDVTLANADEQVATKLELGGRTDQPDTVIIDADELGLTQVDAHTLLMVVEVQHQGLTACVRLVVARSERFKVVEQNMHGRQIILVQILFFFKQRELFGEEVIAFTLGLLQLVQFSKIALKRALHILHY